MKASNFWVVENAPTVKLAAWAPTLSSKVGGSGANFSMKAANFVKNRKKNKSENTVIVSLKACNTCSHKIHIQFNQTFTFINQIFNSFTKYSIHRPIKHPNIQLKLILKQNI